MVGAVKKSAGVALRHRLRDLLVGKTERRLAIVILVTTMVPLAVALYLGTQMFRRAAAVWYSPEIGAQLDRGVDVYKDYVKAIKDDLKHQTVAIAADPVLREAATKRNIETLESEIDVHFPHFPELVTLTILRAPPLPKDDPEFATDFSAKTIARRDRGKPVDAATERSLDFPRACRRSPSSRNRVACGRSTPRTHRNRPPHGPRSRPE